MKAEEFFTLIGESKFYSQKGKARSNTIRAYYCDYLALYFSKTCVEFFGHASANGFKYTAGKLAAKHRDEGAPAVIVDEFYDDYMRHKAIAT